MIKGSFLKKQIEKARKEKKTPRFLRRLIFLVVDHVSIEHYSDTYPMKCLQLSLATGITLEQFNIKSHAIIGEVCFSQVFEDESISPNWNGFWGDDHHVWLCTEFGEFVDLSLRYLHLHPASKSKNQIPMPAIWWEDTTQWPHVIKYLHQGVVTPQLSGSEMEDLELFKTKVLTKLNNVLQIYAVQDIDFEPILYGAESMNELHAKGNLWIQKSIVFQDMNIPYPYRIVEREAELIRNHEKQT